TIYGGPFSGSCTFLRRFSLNGKTPDGIQLDKNGPALHEVTRPAFGRAMPLPRSRGTMWHLLLHIFRANWWMEIGSTLAMAGQQGRRWGYLGRSRGAGGGYSRQGRR